MNHGNMTVLESNLKQLSVKKLKEIIKNLKLENEKIELNNLKKELALVQLEK